MKSAERLERATREFVFIVQLEFGRRDPTRGERQYKGTLSPTNVIKFQERTIEPDGRVSYVYKASDYTWHVSLTGSSPLGGGPTYGVCAYLQGVFILFFIITER